MKTWPSRLTCATALASVPRVTVPDSVVVVSVNARSLVPLLKGDTDFERGPLVWHYPVGVPHIAHSKPGSVIRAGDWKYLRFYEDGREELYNLKNDIGETQDLMASMTEKGCTSVTEAVTKASAMLR